MNNTQHPDLIPVKKSHIQFYNNFDLYHISKEGEPLLYKAADKKLDGEMLDRNQYPQFFIKKKDEAQIIKQLLKVLNLKLAKAISSKGIKTVKQTIGKIMEEALEGPLGISLSSLPETIEILLFGAKKNPDLLDALASMNAKSPVIIEHSINVLALTMQYAFFKELDDDRVKNLALCALLHDIGMTKIGKELIETKDALTDKQFAEYQSHTIRGYREMDLFPSFDKSVALTALEHHERLDGSGYPNRLKNISQEARIIGLIDSYEPLKYREKNFRKALTPYDALQIIKKDVVLGKYSKQMFKDLCSCLIK